MEYFEDDIADPLEARVAVHMTKREYARLVEVLDAVLWDSLPSTHEAVVTEFAELLDDDPVVKKAIRLASVAFEQYSIYLAV